MQDKPTETAKFALDLYFHYKNGYLLKPGNIGQQPHWYIQYMILYSNAAEDVKKEIMTKSSPGVKNG